MNAYRRAVALALFLTAVTTAASADDPARQSLAQMTLEELMNLEVTSVAKKEQPLLDAPQAVFVITSEDLRRSGVTTIAEALRMVPGLSVASIDANKWAIASRGFNDRFANKLLVLIDGRSVYSPLFSGVQWDEQDLVLEDVERIEVIRGPGATLWGANAVSGVINIITKSARDTLGAYGETSADALEGATRLRYGATSGTARYGFRVGERTFARAYVKAFDRASFEDDSGAAMGDAWWAVRGGFRCDRESGANALMVQGDFHRIEGGGRALTPISTPPYEVVEHEDSLTSGGHVLGRWKRSLADSSEIVVQSYLERTQRSDSLHSERRNTADLDLQQRRPLGHRAEVVWGLGYRLTSDDVEGRSGRSIVPGERSDHLASGFVQGELRPGNGRLRITGGSKLEHNSYTGFEVEPGLRLLFKPNARTSLWASVARAVRTPSRVESDMRAQVRAFYAPENLNYVLFVEGNPHFRSEKLVAWELGGRGEVTPRLSVDAALHYDRYDDLRTFEPDFSQARLEPEGPYLVVPIAPDNKAHGRTYGGELLTRWSPAKRLALVLGYAYLRMDLELDDSRDPWVKDNEGYIPRHQLSLRGSSDLTDRLSLDAALYLVDRRPTEPTAGYGRLDLRLGWRTDRGLELSLGGRNLTQRRHRETTLGVISTAANVPRSFYVKAAYRF